MAERDPKLSAPFGGSSSEQSAVPTPDVDLLIIGAGISGIGMAVHASRDLPGKSIAILERRADPGGTWDLFRYPGIRSDSDMHTLGFDFAPWREQKAIADGPSILSYLNRIIDEHGLRDTIRTGHHVTHADWDSATAMWSVRALLDDGSESVTTARWLYMGAGYYDYDGGHDPDFPGRSDFGGQIVHPQFWPEALDYQGKRVIVIGSGATAVTLVPSLADSGAGHVTMLQRTPTWYFIRPAEDRLANGLRRILPEKWAYAITRFKNVRLQNFAFKLARRNPQKVKDALLKNIRTAMGGALNEADFTPPYNPWEQRLCLVPDGDFFNALKEERASVTTGRIARFVPQGVQLESGETLDADIIVTATGLKLAVAGKIAVSVDGGAVRWADHFYYKGCMFSNIPNFAIVFGYLNASWTLKADIVARYTCRLIAEADRQGVTTVVPVLTDSSGLEDEVVFDFSSGYIQRSLDELPKNGRAAPWRLNQDYLGDRSQLLSGPLADGVLAFRNPASVNA